MDKRRVFVTLALLGGGGWAVWDNWVRIVDRLNLDEYSTAHQNAVTLCRDARDFDEDLRNWQFLQARHDRREIRVPMEAWDADLLEGDTAFRVTVEWIEEEEPVVHEWSVELSNRLVVYRGAVEPPESTPAAPR